MFVIHVLYYSASILPVLFFINRNGIKWNILMELNPLNRRKINPLKYIYNNIWHKLVFTFKI